jgi:hypothetical protein
VAKAPETKTKTVEDMIGEIAKAKTPEPVKTKIEPPTKEPSRDQMLAELAKMYNTTPEAVAAELRIEGAAAHSDVLSAEEPKGGPLTVPILIKRAYWAPKYMMAYWPKKPSSFEAGDSRIEPGTIIKVDKEEAKRLMASGVAERADPLPD